jgi:hypothetical protein
VRRRGFFSQALKQKVQQIDSLNLEVRPRSAERRRRAAPRASVRRGAARCQCERSLVAARCKA